MDASDMATRPRRPRRSARRARALPRGHRRRPLEPHSANRTALALLTDGVAPERARPAGEHITGEPPPRRPRPPHRQPRRMRRPPAQPVCTASSWPPPIRPWRGLHAELRTDPGSPSTRARGRAGGARLRPPRTGMPAGPDLHFFSTLATFGTAVDITLAELAIESFFPADPATGRALQAQLES